MSAHTPGPWVLHTSPNCWTVLQAGSSGRWHIAGGTGWGIPGKWAEAEANAHLVKAAPDLLAALKANHQWHLDYDDHGGYCESELCEQNLAAIAKATAAVAEPEPEPIPTGEATDSDFGAFEDAAR